VTAVEGMRSQGSGDGLCSATLRQCLHRAENLTRSVMHESKTKIRVRRSWWRFVQSAAAAMAGRTGFLG
jgi:hypothetical protein